MENCKITTTKEILKEFVEKNMAPHTDWTGTRIETKFKCESLEKFTDKLWEFLEDNYYRV